MNLKEDFGKKFITEVRDRTLDYYEKLSDGAMKSQLDKDLYTRICSLPDDDKAFLKEMISLITDVSLHNMMSFIENEPSSEWRIIHQESGIDLSESSDGLSGELYSDKGWIAKYSKYDNLIR